METRVRCTNRLPGAEPDVTPQQTKNGIFDSSPAKWKQGWIRAGKSSVTNALAEPAQLMTNEQSFAGDEDEGKKKEGDGNKRKESCRDGNHNGK
jgi:hypothetical protein